MEIVAGLSRERRVVRDALNYVMQSFPNTKTWRPDSAHIESREIENNSSYTIAVYFRTDSTTFWIQRVPGIFLSAGIAHSIF